MTPLSRLAPSVAMLLLAVLAIGCRPASAPSSAAPGNLRPVQAVETLARHLRAGDAEAYARDALPPALHARVAVAWRGGHTRWPLDELPFHERLPALLAAFAAPGAEARMRATHAAQFAGAEAEIRAAARALGLFAIQYIRQDITSTDAGREHRVQLVTALGRWAETAPLADPARVAAALPRLSAAARAAGLATPGDFATRGMAPSLRAMSGVLVAAKAVLADYGLSLDASLDGLQATLVDQTGDQARVRLRYTLAGTPIDAIVALARREGRWYLADHLRQAEAAVAAATAAPAAPPSRPGARGP